MSRPSIVVKPYEPEGWHVAVPVLANPKEVLRHKLKVIGESYEGPITKYETGDGFVVVHKTLQFPVTHSNYAEVLMMLNRIMNFQQQHNWAVPTWGYYFTHHPDQESSRREVMQVNLINQFMEAQTLAEHADEIFSKTHGRVRTWLHIAQQMAQILDDFDQAGLAHLDIKPDNILVVGERLYVIDFAFYCLTQAPHGLASCRRRVGAGTPSFMAPEMEERPAAGLLGHVRYRNRADMWSTGAMLAYMLLGAKTWLKPDQSFNRTYLRRITDAEWSELSLYYQAHTNEDPLALYRILIAMLRTEPSKRMSPADLKQELTRVQAYISRSGRTPDYYDQFYQAHSPQWRFVKRAAAPKPADPSDPMSTTSVVPTKPADPMSIG